MILLPLSWSVLIVLPVNVCVYAPVSELPFSCVVEWSVVVSVYVELPMECVLVSVVVESLKDYE